MQLIIIFQRICPCVDHVQGLILDTLMMEKMIEKNIILFQNETLLMRSVSFAQTIFQKLKYFIVNDLSDIKIIIVHLMDEYKLQHVTPDVVLEYLNTNVSEDQKKLQAKIELFSHRLMEILTNQ